MGFATYETYPTVNLDKSCKLNKINYKWTYVTRGVDPTIDTKLMSIVGDYPFENFQMISLGTFLRCVGRGHRCCTIEMFQNYPNIFKFTWKCWNVHNLDIQRTKTFRDLTYLKFFWELLKCVSSRYRGLFEKKIRVILIFYSWKLRCTDCWSFPWKK